MTLSLVDGEFYLNDHPLKRESLDFPKLRAHLEEAGHLDASSRLDAPELRTGVAARMERYTQAGTLTKDEVTKCVDTLCALLGPC